MLEREQVQEDAILRKKEKARLFLGASLAFVVLLSLSFVTIHWDEGYMVSVSPAGSDEENIKYVALTYDDGPNPVYTEKLLQVLEEEHVQASFFMMGKQVENYPQVVKQVATKGHLIGNHTYSHVNVCQLSEERVKEEVQKTNELIYECCGQTPEWFRPPFGCNREKLISGMHMYQVFWNVDPLDWSVQNTGTIVNHVLKYVKDGDIILMHDAYPTTVEATKILIPKLREMGYTFVTVDEMIQP
ncbi:MAG: polysaccharide deacetylase family protein [Lachnospiraceae bacterium]|nr:polysaccharide deacetylase family protein [Lachnospiraceae bacterium]